MVMDKIRVPFLRRFSINSYTIVMLMVSSSGIENKQIFFKCVLSFFTEWSVFVHKGDEWQPEI